MSSYVSPDPEYFEGFMRRVRVWMEDQGLAANPIKIESGRMVSVDGAGTRSVEICVDVHYEANGQAHVWSLDAAEQLSLWHFILFTTA